MRSYFSLNIQTRKQTFKHETVIFTENLARLVLFPCFNSYDSIKMSARLTCVKHLKAVVNTVGGLLASRRVFCWLPFVFFCS